MKKLFTLLEFLVLPIILITSTLSAQTIIRVTQQGAGTQTGSSWTNAAPGNQLQTLINNAVPNTQIWVAAGTYTPTISLSTQMEGINRDNSFLLKNGVALYGGFKGTSNGGMPETVTTRDIAANPTILSGDLGILNNTADDSYHVIVSLGNNSNTILDGFIVEKGNADDDMDNYAQVTPGGTKIYHHHGGGLFSSSSSPTVANIVFRNNNALYFGGGLYNYYSSSTITNCKFIANVSGISGTGGAIDNNYSSPQITNSIFISNISSSGGAIANYKSSISITNSTFYNNRARTQGAGIYNYDVNLACNITNSILYNNTTKVNNGTITLENILGPTTVTYSLVNQDGYADANGNINNDPLFFNPATGDLRLKPNSPAINTGDKNTPILANTNGDINGKPRITGLNVDMGAYESNYPTGANGLIYVKPNGAGNFSGDSWANAAASLADALETARGSEAIKQLWVAQGVYKPAYDPTIYDINNPISNLRNFTFLLKSGLALYGGFKGDETTLESRNIVTHPTILSGGGGSDGDMDNNTYHVILAIGCTNATILDGFIIENGNSNDPNSISQIKIGNNNYDIPNSLAGGMYNAYSSSPIITNSVFRNNRAVYFGGAIYNYAASGPTITNTLFKSNYSSTNGGAIYNDQAQPVIINCSFNANKADTDGGAIHNYASQPLIINSIFSGNSAIDGGAIYSNQNSSVSITNNTLSGNIAFAQGGAIYNQAASTAITNSILYNNTGGEVFTNNSEGAVIITYSLINQIGYAGKDGNLNMNADAKFVDIAGENFRLQSGSPAIDAGNNSDIAGITTDISGKQRIQGKTVDMGAYESIPENIINEEVQVTNIISPNGDGINDQLVIPNLDTYYPGHAELKIVDSAGRIIYNQSNKLLNDPLTWDGKIGDTRVQQGVYFFILTFGPGKDPLKGAITLVY